MSPTACLLWRGLQLEARSNALRYVKLATFNTASTSYASQFHTSSAASVASSAAQKKQRLRQKRKETLEWREVRRRTDELTKPDPVLGHQMNESGQKLWRESELCKVVLTKDEVWGVKEDRRGNLISATIDAPNALSDDASAPRMGPERVNFGLDTEQDRSLLFSQLPAVMLEDKMRSVTSINRDRLDEISRQMEDNEGVEAEHANLLSRILDLRNASGKGIQVENIRRIVRHFGTRTKDGRSFLDTGCPEVQAAVLTYRIRNLYEHLEHARHDNANRRSVAQLVHQRAKMLRYLKGKSIERYNSILPRLGLEARAVEGEIIVPGKPLMKMTA